MSLVEQFILQRTAFEKTYADDDWSRLTPFFSPDVRYEVIGMPFHCVVTGRDAMFAALKKSLDGFDRKCVRKIGPGAFLRAEGANVMVYGEIIFRYGDSPENRAKLWEITTYKDGVIERMIDLYEGGEAEAHDIWMAQWGGGLDPAYV